MDHTFHEIGPNAAAHPGDVGGLHRAERIITAARERGSRPLTGTSLADPPPNRRIVPRKREATRSTIPGPTVPDSAPAPLSALRADSPMDPWSRAYSHLAENISDSLPFSGEAIFAVLTPGGPPPYPTIMLTGAAVADQLACDVLLIDGNYGESRLARRIGLEPKQGLGEIVAGTADWTRTILQTNVPGLWLLPATEFRRGDRCSDARWMQSFLNALRNRYRVILFTAGKPNHPGVRDFLAYCTGAYLVVRLGLTTDRLAKKTIRQAEDSGCRILGCVVTHD